MAVEDRESPERKPQGFWNSVLVVECVRAAETGWAGMTKEKVECFLDIEDAAYQWHRARMRREGLLPQSRVAIIPVYVKPATTLVPTLPPITDQSGGSAMGPQGSSGFTRTK